MKTKRIAIVGPESTGKSDLCQQLARELKTEWVPEYARFYLDRLDREYEENDLLAIAQGQLAWEDQKIPLANEWLICDTNLIVIKIWSDHKFGATNSWILENLETRVYDGYLLTAIDLPWQNDPQREHPHLRKHFFDLYHDYLSSHKLPFRLVQGIEGERLQSALKGLSEMGMEVAP